MDNNIALHLGDLDAMMTMSGNKRDLSDLIVAATALELDYAVATRNLKHFKDIPGLRIASSVRPA